MILNIENKDVLLAFCLKDQKRTRDKKFFGTTQSDGGDISKVERGETYLEDNLVQVSQLLGWELDSEDPPDVLSFFVSRRFYWWTMFPPRATEVKSLRVDTLHEFLQSLPHHCNNS